MRILKLPLSSLEIHRKIKLSCLRGLRGFIFRISVEHMGSHHQVYMTPSCNFTQNYYLNPECSFSPRVSFVQICCSWERGWCDTKNIFLSLCRAACERNGFDASSPQANRRVVWQIWAESSDQPTVNHKWGSCWIQQLSFPEEAAEQSGMMWTDCFPLVFPPSFYDSSWLFKGAREHP